MTSFGSKCEYTYDQSGEIGRGGYGAVYKATVRIRGDFTGADIVAVKSIFLKNEKYGAHKSDQTDHQQGGKVERLGGEPVQTASTKWKSLLNLKHKNIVCYHKITVTDAPHGSTIELMMDYCPDGDLASFISRHGPAISLIQLIDFAHQIAEGVAYLHSDEVRVIHGDLKPANIMLRRISDSQFILQIGDLDDRIVMIHNKTCTKDVKHALGTVRYMSPEMVKKSVGKSTTNPGRKTDIWSLGCTILDLADFHVGIQSKWLHHKKTKETIRIDGRLESVTLLHIADGYVPLVNELAPKKIAQIIDECLNEDDQKRISAADLVKRLKHVHAELETADDLDNTKLQFHQIKMIDRDSSGTIFEARRLDTDAVIAVRRITLDDDTNRRAAQLNVLQSRFAVITELDHSNVVSYFRSQIQLSYRFEMPTYDIFMEYCAGNVSNLKQPNITALHVQRWTRQLVDGLAYIHGRGVVHRNITEYNILMTSMDIDTCRVKIGGLCDVLRLLSKVQGETSFGKDKWDYMSPEMIFDEDSETTPFDGRTDIWGLGCVMLQMATGRRPEFYKKQADGTLVKVYGALAIMYFIGTGGTPRISAQLPLEIQSFAKACLLRDPRERPSAADLKNHEFLTAPADEVTQWALPRPAAQDD